MSMDEDNSNMARLGVMFFSSAYMMVNHDKSEFSIAPARKVATEVTLVGINTANNCVAYLNGTVPGHTPQSLSPPDAEGSNAALSTGAIAGIAVGAVAAVILLAVIAFLLWRRRNRSKAFATRETIVSPTSAKELHVDQEAAAELYEAPPQAVAYKMMADERDHAIELDGNSRVAELPAAGRT